MSLPSGAQVGSTRYRATGAVEEVQFKSGSATRFVATGEVTDGEFGLFEWFLSPSGGGPSPHFHKTFSESFNGERWIRAQAGDFLYVPARGVHAFRNEPTSRPRC